MHTQPSRWIWLAPLAVSVLAGWLTLNGITPEAASVTLSVQPQPAAASITSTAYPAPRVDPTAPFEEPAPTF